MVYLETLLIRGENMYKNYSVLMTVYYKENPTFFETAIESILNQTLKTNDFVIVADGPLGEPLEAVLRKYESNPIFTIVRTPENKGSGAASQAGLPYIKNEVFAKMDSDDISVPERMEKELALNSLIIHKASLVYVNHLSNMMILLNFQKREIQFLMLRLCIKKVRLRVLEAILI